MLVLRNVKNGIPSSHLVLTVHIRWKCSPSNGMQWNVLLNRGDPDEQTKGGWDVEASNNRPDYYYYIIMVILLNMVTLTV